MQKRKKCDPFLEKETFSISQRHKLWKVSGPRPDTDTDSDIDTDYSSDDQRSMVFDLPSKFNEI